MFVFALSLTVQLALQVGPQVGPSSDAVVQEPDRVVISKVTALDFTAATLTGARASPTGARIYARPKGHRRNLIEMRASFRPELVVTPDHL